jgi:hypothetical protein
LIRLVVALFVAVLAGACAVVTPEAPVVVSGTLVDGTGQPVPGAQVTLDVFDDRNVRPEHVVPTVLHAETTSGADGRFEFRFAPTIELRRFVGANTGFVNFSLTAFERSGGLFWGWSFPREMGIDGWIDDVTPVRLMPIEGVP